MDMAEETDTVIESRIGGSDAFKKAIAAAIGGLSGAAAGNPISLTTQFVTLHNVPNDDELTEANAASTELKTADGYGGRLQVAWDVPASIPGPPTRARITAKTPLQFTVPAGTVTHYSVWTAATNGTFLYGKELSAKITLSSAGNVSVTPTHSYGLL